jgi:hypothetical protein
MDNRIIPDFIVRINNQLASKYGYFEGMKNCPNFRVVWSNDQYEHRLTAYTKEGLQLIHPEVRYLPKYSQWLSSRWVIEKCVPIPELNRKDLVAEKFSYEPLHGFINVYTDKPIDPTYRACEFLVENVLAQLRVRNGIPQAKYEDPLFNASDPKISREVKEAHLNELERELFGNDTSVTDKLMTQEAVIVPSNFEKMVKEI